MIGVIRSLPDSWRHAVTVCVTKGMGQGFPGDYIIYSLLAKALCAALGHCQTQIWLCTQAACIAEVRVCILRIAAAIL